MAGISELLMLDGKLRVALAEAEKAPVFKMKQAVECVAQAQAEYSEAVTASVLELNSRLEALENG